MSEIVIYCRACSMAHRPVDCFPTICPNPDCQINPARWTTFRPLAAPLETYHPSTTDNAFLKSLHITEND